MFNLEIPLNSLSFGQVSFGILQELFSRNINPNIQPIGGINLDAFDLEQSFSDWLNFCIEKTPYSFNDVNTTVKLWHLNGSYQTIQSQRNVLLTAHETDTVTETERYIARSKDLVLFTSEYSRDVFLSTGLTNIGYCPNYFDTKYFYKKEIPKKGLEDVVTFGLFGKFEKRKLTSEIITLWGRYYGNNPKYRLNCCIINPHVDLELQKVTISSLFRGQIPWNINFLPFQVKNSSYNDVLNSIDIDLSGLSGAEGWNLPAFQTLCLGKVGIFLDAHGHQSYIKEADCVKVEPSGKTEIYDNVFFKKGHQFNQGNMFTFSEDSFYKATQEAISRLPNFTGNGDYIANKFNVKNTVDIILNSI